TISPCVLARHAHRCWINIGSKHVGDESLGGGNGEDARARAHVENSARSPTPRECIERPEAAFGAGVLARAECHGGIDQQPGRARRKGAAMMRAVDEVAADPARRETLLVLAHPVARRHFLEQGFRWRSVIRPGQGERGFEPDTRERYLRETLDEPPTAVRFLEETDGPTDGS